MYKLTLNDGTELDTTGAGAADGNLWIFGLNETFVEAAEIFADEGKTARIRIWYQESLPEDVFEGYTELRHIMQDDDGLKVCLRKE